MRFTPRRAQILGAIGCVVVWMFGLASMRVGERDAGIELINFRRQALGRAIVTEFAEVTIEAAVLLQHEDDVLDGIGAGTAAVGRYRNHGVLRDGVAGCIRCGCGVGSGGGWRDGGG